jgi:hypothetical protein
MKAKSSGSTERMRVLKSVGMAFVIVARFAQSNAPMNKHLQC